MKRPKALRKREPAGGAEFLTYLGLTRQPTVLVVGDLIGDHFIWGDVDRISPEAPVQVMGVEHESDLPGGAANVAMNLASLGCRVRLAGIVGRDVAGQTLLRTLRAHGVGVDGQPTFPTCS